MLNEKKTVDLSVLSNDQKLFLENRVDLVKWKKESDEFRRKTEIYMAEMSFYAEAEKNHQQMLDWEKTKVAYEAHCRNRFFINLEENEDKN